MAGIDYLDFDLRIERVAGAEIPPAYRVEVVSSPAGQAAGDLKLPFSDLELENILLRLGHTRRGVRGIESPETETAKTFGGRLFAAVFAGEVQICFRDSLDKAAQQGAGLRLRLRLTDAPELVDLPWEYLYNPALNRFLVLSAKTPLVRYLDLPERIHPLAVTPPLRVLAMIASPRDYPPLDVEREWAKLRAALDTLEQRGLVALERLEIPTLPALQQRLRQAAFHIFHFVGHGGFDQQAQDGILIMEDEDRHSWRVSGQDLGTLLHDEDTLRLAILNACEGARASRTDPFGGAAQSLVQQGVPAVIAMQFEVTDEAAITLAQEFYRALADAYPVDAALAEARKALFAQENGVEWGTPVLYLRAEDGRIFDVAQVSDEDLQQTRIATLQRESQAAIDKGDWTTALAKLQALQALDPTNAATASKLKQVSQQQEQATAPVGIGAAARRILQRHSTLLRALVGAVGALALLIAFLAVAKAAFAPKVRAFTVDPSNLVAGQVATVHLVWDVESADTVSIEPGVGLVGPVSNRNPAAPITTTVYTLLANNIWGQTRAQARVQVAPPPDPVVTIPQPLEGAIVTTDLVFEAHAYDPLRGTKDGDGISYIDMDILDSNNQPVYHHKESSPRYCAFSGDRSGEPCPAFPFAKCDNKWATLGCDRDVGQPIKSGDYLLRATAHTKDGRTRTVESRIKIQLAHP